MAVQPDLRPTLQLALQQSLDILNASSFLSARQGLTSEAEQIVIHCFRSEMGHWLKRVDLYTRRNDPISEALLQAILRLANQRAEGIPLQHLFGYQHFLDHEYFVGPEVLVPRPETEVLVSAALEILKKSARSPEVGLEIGLGSGVISIELLKHFPALKMFASEQSIPAIEVAKKNCASILGEDRRLEIIPVKHPLDVCEPFQEKVAQNSADFLISNPPYLGSTDEVDEDVARHEPHQALFAPASDVLHFYRLIVEQVRYYLKPQGRVLLELPHERASLIQDLFDQGEVWDTELIFDLNQRQRVLSAKLRK